MRLSAKIAIVILAPIVGYFGYDSLMGHWLVHRLCAKDGGLRIHETAFVDGYLDESESNPYSCLGCFWKLAKHQFKYVDVHVRGRTPEYFRFSLASKGDPRCEPSRDTFMRYGWSKLRRKYRDRARSLRRGRGIAGEACGGGAHGEPRACCQDVWRRRAYAPLHSE